MPNLVLLLLKAQILCCTLSQTNILLIGAAQSFTVFHVCWSTFATWPHMFCCQLQLAASFKYHELMMLAFGGTCGPTVGGHLSLKWVLVPFCVPFQGSSVSPAVNSWSYSTHGPWKHRSLCWQLPQVCHLTKHMSFNFIVLDWKWLPAALTFLLTLRHMTCLFYLFFFYFFAVPESFISILCMTLLCCPCWWPWAALMNSDGHLMVLTWGWNSTLISMPSTLWRSYIVIRYVE